MYCLRNYTALLLFMLICNCALSQNASGRMFVVPADGDNDTRILTLYQGSQGYIFTGTNDGLYRFDGIDFVKFPQPAGSNTSVTAICEVGNNQLWIGFDNGTIGMLKNNRVILLQFEEGYPKAAIKKIIAGEKGSVWIATAGEGIYYFVNNRLYNINTADGLSDNYVYDIIYNSYAGIIAATDRGLNSINLKDGKKLIRSFTSKDGLPDNIVRCLYSTSQPSVWFGMQDGGIGAAGTSLNMIDQSPSWNYGQVNGIVSTTSRIFIATEDNGMLMFEHDSGNRITAFSGSDATLKKISCLLRDREGNIWAGGDNKLLLLTSTTIEYLYPFPKAKAERIHSLLYARNNSIWCNTPEGVIKVSRDKDGWKEQNYPIEGVAGADISTLYEDINGIIWIGTLGKGIFHLDPRTGKQQKLLTDSIFYSGNIISISGKESDVLIAGLEGTAIARSTPQGINVHNFTGDKSIGNKYIYHILKDSRGRVWFATDGNGIIMQDKDRFVSFDQDRPKSESVVYRIVEDPAGNIWYATFNSGVVKYNGSTFQKFTIDNGLGDHNITGLAVSKDNIAAIHRNRIDLINSKTGNITFLDQEQGITNINTDINAYSTDAEGNLYFLSDTMLCKYHASYNASRQPKVMIDHVELFLNDVDVASGHKFRYDENNINIHYTGLYYSAPGRIQYQYKLEGYDEDWMVTRDKVKTFPMLPPGTYTFRVRASVSNNFTAAPEASFTFTILKPFWKTAWFIIAAILLTALLIYFLIKSRERSINRLNRLERETIRSQLETLKSQINPHFLFNSFNTLISEIEENPSTAITYVEKLSDFFRSIVSYREKDLVLLQEEMNLLDDYAYIQQRRFGQALQVHNSITPGQATHFQVAPLALQLLIENAVKHNVVSSVSPLLVELFIDEDHYLVVRNNIIPKLHKEKGSGMGLENIIKRYELLSDRKVVIDNDGRHFTVKIPVIKLAV